MKKILPWILSAFVYMMGAVCLDLFSEQEAFSLSYFLLLIPAVWLITAPVMEYWHNRFNKWFTDERSN
jgi:nitrate/nitrite transporter NarK